MKRLLMRLLDWVWPRYNYLSEGLYEIKPDQKKSK